MQVFIFNTLEELHGIFNICCTPITQHASRLDVGVRASSWFCKPLMLSPFNPRHTSRYAMARDLKNQNKTKLFITVSFCLLFFPSLNCFVFMHRLIFLSFISLSPAKFLRLNLVIGRFVIST